MITLNYKSADSSSINDGLNILEEFANYKDSIASIITDLNQRKDKPGQWLRWMNLGYSEETAWYVKEYAALVKGRFDNVLVLGIGGSALGGLAVTEALLKPYWNFLSKEERENYPRIFFLDNIDPDTIVGLLNVLDLKKTLVNVITKSGSTAETMAQFMIIKDAMEKDGMNYIDAAIQAARLRFRAVMMTNIAFILGLLPLVFAQGAGAGSRHSIGISVFGGMLAVAFIGSILVPAFFVAINYGKEYSLKYIKNEWDKRHKK